MSSPFSVSHPLFRLERVITTIFLFSKKGVKNTDAIGPSRRVTSFRRICLCSLGFSRTVALSCKVGNKRTGQEGDRKAFGPSRGRQGLTFRAASQYVGELLNTQGVSIASTAWSDDFPSGKARPSMAYRASPKLLSNRPPIAWRPSSVRFRVPVPTKLWWPSVGVSATQALFFQAYQAFRSWS